MLFIIFLSAAAGFSFFSDASRKNFVVFQEDRYWYPFLIIYLAAAFGAMYLTNLAIDKYGTRCYATALTLILSASFLTRFTWINLFDVTPRNDFSLYYNIAVQYAGNNFIGKSYISMFPHTFGYPFILSQIYKIFGSSIYAALIFNVLLGCGITALLGFLGTRLLNRKAGLLAALVYAFWPSQVFYTALVSTEELFTFLMLLCICLFAASLKNSGRLPARMTFVAFLCAVLNGIRPFGILLISAFFNVTLFYGLSLKLSLKDWLKKYLSSALVLAAAYTVFFNLACLGVSSAINKEVARSPVGFNLFIGSNIKYKGVWNAEDAEIYAGLTKNADFGAQQVHDEFTAMAIRRYKEQRTDNLGLFKEKFKAMWSADYDVIEYIKSGLNTSSNSSGNFYRMQRYLTAACNLFYLAMLFFSLIFALQSIRRSDYISLTVMLIVLGIAFIHLLMEVHGRYHYPAVPLLALAAGCGANMLFKGRRPGERA